MTIPVGFGEATYIFGGAGLPNGGAVTMGFENVTDEDAATAAQDMHNAFNNEVLPVLASEISLVETRVKLGPDDTGPIGVYSPGATAGGDGANCASSQVCYLVGKQTAIGGRRGRGRMFLPGVGEAYVSPGGVVTGSQVLVIQAAMDDYLSNATGVGVPPVLLHDPSTHWVLDDGQPKRVPNAGAIPVPTPITSFSVASLVATQRRRVR